MDLLEHHFHPDIAVKIGVNAAIFLRDIYHWCDMNRKNGKNFYEGRWWTYQTMKGLGSRHPYWSKNQVEYIIKTCKEQGLLLSGHFGEDQFDRTCWYALSDKGLALFEIRSSNSENSEFDFRDLPTYNRKIQKCNIEEENITENKTISCAVLDEAVMLIRPLVVSDESNSAQNAVLLTLEQHGFSCQHGAPINTRGHDKRYTGRVNVLAAKAGKTIAIEIDRLSPRKKSIYKLQHFDCDYRLIVLRGGEEIEPPEGIDAVISIATSEAPDLFQIFWSAYPKKLDKKKANEAFTKLHVTPDLLQTMLAAIEQQKKSRQWQERRGQFIPYASTWLNGHRWEDDLGDMSGGKDASPGHVVEDEEVEWR